jgi:polyhydroxybutyrate depolymerase
MVSKAVAPRRAFSTSGLIGVARHPGKLQNDHNIAPGHVFETGMPNGGFVSNKSACDRANVFAAIAPVANTLGVGVAGKPLASNGWQLSQIQGLEFPDLSGPRQGTGDGAWHVAGATQAAERVRVSAGQCC